MRWLGGLVRRLSHLIHRERFDRELEREMQFHLEMQAEENAGAGMGADEARDEARRQFGNMTRLRETAWEMWGWAWVDHLVQDLRYAVRLSRRHPGFTAVAVLTLALGIGVTTSIFGFADRLLMRPLPFPESDRLVSIGYRLDTSAEPYEGLSYPDYLHYRDRNGVLSGLAAYGPATADVQFGVQTESVAGELVSANYFSVLGVQPARGRLFLPEEDRTPDAHAVVILSHGLWQRRFGGDSEVIGQAVVMNRRSFTVVGVAPPGFSGLRLDRGSRPEFWVPTMMYPTIATFAGGMDLRTYWGNHWLSAVGRLEPGTSLDEASRQFARLGAELKQGPWKDVWGEPNAGAAMGRDNPLYLTATLIPANEMRLAPRSRASVATALGMLGAAVGIVLLTACFNVATLLLARASGRKREMAVRLAIGAGRARVMRQLVTEGLVLSLLGGGAGLLAAALTSRLLASIPLPFRFPLLLETGVDARIAGFALLLSVLTAVLISLVPAREALSVDLTPALKVDPGSGSRVRRWSVRNALVVAQVALSVLLLVAAGLFLRTLANARTEDVTVEPGRVLMTRLDTRAPKYDESQGQAFYAQLLERVGALPGVRGAALVMVVPMGGRRGGTDVSVSAPGNPSEKHTLQVDYNIVSPTYFDTVGIPIVRGRPFSIDDRPGAPAVAIVNEQWARRFWPGADPLGQRFEVPRQQRTLEVVGVVKDGKFRSYRSALNPCFYVPLAQQYSPSMHLEVRTAGSATGLAGAVRLEMLALDRDLPVSAMQTLEAYRDGALGQERMAAGLLSALGGLALGLAAIGLYGVVSFSVARRTREIGIRVALGARRSGILRMVLAQGLAPTLIGLAVGLAAAWAVTRLISSLLYEVSPTDPWTFAATAAVLTAAALVACIFPARRATDVDPIEALRNE